MSTNLESHGGIDAFSVEGVGFRVVWDYKVASYSSSHRARGSRQIVVQL